MRDEERASLPRGGTPDHGKPAASTVLHYSSGGTDAAPGGGWVHVWKAADPFEANLIVGKLQEHGIHARVDMENAAALGAFAGVGAGGTTVQALADDAAAARRILEQVEQDRARRREAATVACPRCGRRPAKRLLHPARKAAVGLLFVVPVLAAAAGQLDAGPLGSLVGLGGVGLLLVLLLVNVVPRWRCPACRHQWAQPDPPAADEEDEA